LKARTTSLSQYVAAETITGSAFNALKLELDKDAVEPGLAKLDLQYNLCLATM
jgi:hypothetical protein